MDQVSHKKQTISGIRWAVLNQVINQGLIFVTSIVLMRIINPKEFGILGMVTVFSGFLTVFTDFGLGSSLIQKKNILKIDYDTIFWTTILLGAILCVLLILIAPVLVAFYHEDKLFWITIALSSGFLIQSIGGTHLSIAKKELSFKKLFTVNITGIFAGVIVVLILAIKGYGVWALVIQQITIALVNTILLWVKVKYRPQFHFSKQILKGHLNFSLPLVGSNSLNYWSRNADNFFIGKFFGAFQLGIYSKSYSFMMIPISNISGVISSVMFPSLAIIQDDYKRVTTIFLKMTRVIAFVTFPLMAMLYIGAGFFVRGVLGENWIQMIPVIKILSIIGATQSLGTLIGNILLVTNNTMLALKLNIFTSVLYVTLFFIGSQYSIVVLSILYLGANIILLPIGWILIGKMLNTSFKLIALNTINHFTALVLILLTGNNIFSNFNFNPWLGLVLTFIFVLSGWLLFFFIFDRKLFLEFVQVVKEGIRK